MSWPKAIKNYFVKKSANWGLPEIACAYISDCARFERMGQPNNDEFLSALANRWIDSTDLETPDMKARGYGKGGLWITHLQYASRYGVILTAKPWTLYCYFQIRHQYVKPDGTRVPGSELCLTFRCGEGRWQADSQTYDVPTLQAGLHWD